MRPILLAAALLIAGCATFPEPAPPGGDAVSGLWRAPSGQTLSISHFSTFATQRGCTITGGVLKPLGGGLYRVDRYTSGISSDQCGPWRSGPDIAPFDGTEVRLQRSGRTLVAEGAGRSVTFHWVGRSPV